MAGIDTAEVGGTEQAMLTLEVQDRYLASIPSNVIADVRASSVFGNEYVSFDSPETPSPLPLSRDEVIRVQSVTTEFNTLFETITSIANKVDPIKLNQTLTAAAEGFDRSRH